MMQVLQAPASGRRERKRSETHHKLLTCALRLFAERGFANTTVEHITEAADVGKGTFFNYFPSKEHVLMNVAQIQISKYEHALDAIAQPGTTARDVLHTLYFELPQLPLSSPGLLRSLLSMFLTNEQLRGRVSEGFRQGRAALKHIIEVGQKNGEIRRDRTPEALSIAFQRSLIGAGFLWTLDDETEHRSWLDSAWDLFWSATCAGAAGLGDGSCATPRRSARRKQ